MCLALPSFADVGSDFDGSTNLIDSSSTINTLVDGSLDGLQPFYLLNLQPNKTYSFISTKGVDRVLCSPVVYNPDFTYPIVYSFDTYNLSKTNSFTVNIPSGSPYVEYRISNPLPAGTYNISYEVDSPVYNLNSVFGSGSSTYLLAPNYRYITSSSKFVSGTITITQSMVDQGKNYIYIRPIEGASASGVSVKSINIFLADSSESVYIPVYSKTFYKDSQLFVYSFTTPGSLSGQYALGFKDSTIDSDSLYSRITSDDNTVYLIEGDVSMDSFIDAAYNNGYNSGYDQGYKEGEYDGMNSTSILKSVILTVMSGPFVIVSNALNFEIFGINIYTFIQIILTILIVAFLITRLKGRE